MWSQTDRDFMRRALELAKMGRYTTSPNPCVGCVIVRDGNIIGEGYHHKAGQPHAEINAIADAGGNVEGATVYVTLEPCSHYGKTPPCASKLVELKVKRVVVAVEDPNPLVRGKGIKILQEHGIEVSVGLMARKASNLNRRFFKSVVTKTPYVTVKLGMSLDAKVALKDGTSQWITNSTSRSHVQQLRAGCDAIISSVNTVMADNPGLNVRYPELPAKVRRTYDEKTLRQPLKIILDSNGKLEKRIDEFKLFKEGQTLLVMVAPKQSALKPVNKNVKFLYLYSEGKKVDLRELLAYLGTIQIRSVLVEAGANLACEFIDQDLCDELVCFVSPKILGRNAQSAFLTRDLKDLDQKDRFRLAKAKKLKGDICLRYLRRE